MTQEEGLMSELDALFIDDRDNGVQDIWFLGLDRSQAEALFEGARRMSASNQPSPTAALPDGEWVDMCLYFSPLQVGDVALKGVCLRVEDTEVAVDFNPGLDYWTPQRQWALMDWLRALLPLAPNATLIWAQEGCINSPDAAATDALRRAVLGPAGRGDVASE
jgi:hypothetical protein